MIEQKRTPKGEDRQKYKVLYDELYPLKNEEDNPECTEISKEQFYEDNINKILILAHCYTNLYKLNKDKTINIFIKNKSYIESVAISNLIDLNWINDSNMSGNARFIIESHIEHENEEIDIYFIIDDYKACLNVSTEIIEKIKEYLIKNLGEPSPFDWHPIESINYFEKKKEEWEKEMAEYIKLYKSIMKV